MRQDGQAGGGVNLVYGFLGAGQETLETRLFRPEEIPWDNLAFPSVRIALEQYVENRRTGNLRVRLATAPRLRLG